MANCGWSDWKSRISGPIASMSPDPSMRRLTGAAWLDGKD
jgi:hypothetical protein